MEYDDLVVHIDHGIAKYKGLVFLKEKGRREGIEYLYLEFDGGVLHVPADRCDLVRRYVGPLHGKPTLSKLGNKKWKIDKERVEESIRNLATGMLQVQAIRKSTRGHSFESDSLWLDDFESGFPFKETDDQFSAIQAVKKDMDSIRPMDRLICGDVGFGKTEIAMRAAFKACQVEKQVAILVPTTVLAEQHGEVFKSRFSKFPFQVEVLSRFRKDKEISEIISRVKEGAIDVLIGTHRLLSKDILFKDLGLIIIDEEQRFGVSHKHRLLANCSTVDQLTLTATPIPRTLHMAMLGLRDISSLTTAPQNRQSIITEIVEYDLDFIKVIIEKELSRGGQVFVVHNRVKTVYETAQDISNFVPNANIIVAHGQMNSLELSGVMKSFISGKADVLVSTTIIESGIDIPKANTIIITDSDRYGLAQLHQLRGRVGRSRNRGYCYLLTPKDRIVSSNSLRRLKALERFTMLGSGFKIALRDLEIRGAGNLLGSQQSGHIAAVGYDLYCELLERAVKDISKENVVDIFYDIVIDIGIRGTIPEGYIPSEKRRLDVYRRFSETRSIDDLELLIQDLSEAYGSVPEKVKLLIDLIRLRILAYKQGIVSIVLNDKDIVIRSKNVNSLIKKINSIVGTKRIVGKKDQKGIDTLYLRTNSIDNLVKFVARLLDCLGSR